MSHSNAALAKMKLDYTVVGENRISLYFIRVFAPDPEEGFLQPPPMEKQFLISPPCSPPVGWEQPRNKSDTLRVFFLCFFPVVASVLKKYLNISTTGIGSVLISQLYGISCISLFVFE